MVYGTYYMVYVRVFCTFKKRVFSQSLSKKKKTLMHRHRTQAVFFYFHKFYKHIGNLYILVKWHVKSEKNLRDSVEQI